MKKKTEEIADYSFKHILNPYEFSVFFYFTGNIQLAHKHAKQRWVPGSCVDEGGETHHVGDHSYCLYVFINHKCLTHSLLAHEIAHAAHAICAQVGIDADFMNDEAEAYIVYDLHRFIYKNLKKRGVEVKDNPYI